MAHISTSYETPAAGGIFTPNFFSKRLSNAIAKFKMTREARITIGHLSEYSDAQLADIGLLRSDLAEGKFEAAADAKALAMLRVYR